MVQNWQIRKVQQISHSSTVSIVLPKEMCMDLGVKKGDWMKVSLDGNKIVIAKVEEESNE